MSLQQTRSTALYLRLSNDDGNVGDSDSIVNQRAMLTKYARDNGFRNIIEFVDDGHSGGNFQRPGFQRMLGMVENGEIGAIIVKDLPRLSRYEPC
jgi:DNA invertase Pin-like site-specific DNA recombinase